LIGLVAHHRAGGSNSVARGGYGARLAGTRPRLHIVATTRLQRVLDANLIV
jgi:hypothetical protein